MTDPAVYSEKLSAFSRMLRLEGLNVSPKETMDACQILAVLGFEDKSLVKTALRTIYAKSKEEQILFDQVFDGFFLSEEAMRAQAKEAAHKDAQVAQARQEAMENVQLREFTPEQLETYATMPEEAREKLRQFLEKYKDSSQRSPELYANFIHSVFAKALLEQQIQMEEAGSGGMAKDPELGLMYRDISQFKDTDIPKAITIIQSISRQINGELSAKRNKGAHSGKLDFRRTIRKGLETGGSLYRLSYKRKRNRRKHLVVLCDVSGSMIQFSEFALRFIQLLNQASESSRVFLFSETVFEADAFNLQNMDLFRNYVKDCGVYGKGTDLGSALEHLCSAKPAILNPSTTLLILSDTKTIDQDRATLALLQAKQLAGRILWLNPLPESHWHHIRSVQTFSSVCSMVSCSTLHSLADACRKLTL
ncbi:MAG: VWA domain-containing protein [Oscillospiraceae bacterium]|nr:VWA domain-containing protein [Oscillospiraceae bacterium]